MGTLRTGDEEKHTHNKKNDQRGALRGCSCTKRASVILRRPKTLELQNQVYPPYETCMPRGALSELPTSVNNMLSRVSLTAYAKECVQTIIEE